MGKFGNQVSLDHLIATACDSQAGLGWTLDETIQAYGQATDGPIADKGDGKTAYSFAIQGYKIYAWYFEGKVSVIAYTETETVGLSKSAIDAFLASNAPLALWSTRTKGDYGEHTSWIGRLEDGSVACIAFLHDHEKTLIITNEVKDLTDVPPAVGGVDGAVNVVLFPLIL